MNFTITRKCFTLALQFSYFNTKTFRVYPGYALFLTLRRSNGYKTIIMDATKHHVNEFEDYSSSTSHNIVDNDTNTVRYKLYLIYYLKFKNI